MRLHKDIFNKWSRYGRISAGQTLAEVVIVTAMVILLVSSIVVGTTTSIAQSRETNFRTEANKYAQEGLELTRHLRDLGWSAFAALGTDLTVYCVGSDTAFIPAEECTTANIDNTAFIRSVSLELLPESVDSVEKMHVIVRVRWEDNTVTQTTYLTQWQ